MIKVVLRQLLRTWDRGLIYILTFVLCSLCSVALIIPLRLLRQDIDERRNSINVTYYSYVCEGFSGSDLNSMEKDIKEIEPEFIIIPSVEYEVSYKNFSGTGRAMTISDSGFEKLGKSYGSMTDYFLCLNSGRIPENEAEVATFLGIYGFYYYSHDGETVEKAVVLPEIGECEATGKIELRNDLYEMIVDIQGGVIVRQNVFDKISGGNTVKLFVVFQETLSLEQELELKKAISKYANVLEAYCISKQYDEEADIARFNLAAELSALLILAVIACLVFVQSDLLYSNTNICRIMKQMGLSEPKIFTFNFVLLNIYILISETALYFVLQLSKTSERLRFINPGSEGFKWIIIVAAYLIALLTYIVVYLRNWKVKSER